MRIEFILASFILVVLVLSFVIPQLITKSRCEKLGVTYADKGGCFDSDGNYQLLWKIKNMTSGEIRYELTHKNRSNEGREE